MNRHQKRTLYRILLSALLFALGILTNVLYSLHPLAAVAVMLPAYLLIGYDVLWQALGGIGRGQMFDENFLMSIASIGAFCVGESSEAVAVMLFYQVGELFQNIAVGRSRRSISDLLDILPESATILKDGAEVTVDPQEVEVGQILLVRPGEKIPLDGEVVSGHSFLDTASLTGEALPLEVQTGSTVYSGTINLQGVLHIRCTKPFTESTASKIMELVENSEMHKSKTERFISRFAHYYTPIVVLCALTLAVLPPLFLGIADFAVWSNWIHTALVFLIVSCPCALVISVPMAFFAGIGVASRYGILVKGADHLETLARCKTIAMDKTGTLTKGSFQITEVHCEKGDREQLLTLAALAEHHSSHPIALCLKNALPCTSDIDRIASVSEIAGGGMIAEIDGTTVLVGNEKLLSDHGVSAKAPTTTAGSCIHLAQNGLYLGHILIADTPKEDAAEAVSQLNKMGIETVLLTGDRKENAKALCETLGIMKLHAELLPKDKVTHFETIQTNTKGAVAFVGDGINDAPALARADVGVAMGGIGSDAAIEAADVVIMDDKPTKVAKAIRIAKKTMTIVRQNIVLALGVKIAIMLLDIFVSIVSVSPAAMTWIAVFGDVGVAVIAILNSLRMMGA